MAEEEKKPEQAAKEGEKAAEGDADEAAAPKKKIPWLKIIPLALHVGMSGGAVGLVFYTLRMDPKHVASEFTERLVLDETKNTLEDLSEKLFPLETFFINLNGNNGRDYLKATMQFEVFDPHVVPELTTKLPIIRDIVIQSLSEKARKDLDSVQDKLFLKGQIINKINKKLATGSIRSIYLTQFLIQ